eukprot:scaffold129999_cov23-Tisochrysis_lutea.AAC.1
MRGHMLGGGVSSSCPGVSLWCSSCIISFAPEDQYPSYVGLPIITVRRVQYGWSETAFKAGSLTGSQLDAEYHRR